MGGREGGRDRPTIIAPLCRIIIIYPIFYFPNTPLWWSKVCAQCNFSEHSGIFLSTFTDFHSKYRGYSEGVGIPKAKKKRGREEGGGMGGGRGEGRGGGGREGGREGGMEEGGEGEG